MTEPAEDIIRNGYVNWKENLIIGVPFLLSGLIAVGIILALVIVLFILGIQFGMSMSLLLTMGLVTTAAIFLIMLVDSFFEAGAIGMAKNAIETGGTSFSDMLSYGRKKFFSLFFASIIISLIVLMGVVLLLIPVVAAFMSGLINVGLSLSVLALALFMLYNLALSIVLIPVSYAIVVSDLGAVEGIKEGYRFFMENKLSVLFLFFVNKGVLWGCGLIIGLITSLIEIIPILGVFINLGVYLLYVIFIAAVLMPILTVWWTRLYMGRTGAKLGEGPAESSPRAPEQETETPIQEQFYI